MRGEPFRDAPEDAGEGAWSALSTGSVQERELDPGWSSGNVSITWEGMDQTQGGCWALLWGR